MNVSALKAKIKSGRPTFGSWITLGHPAVAEIMAQAGFDWLAIDLEHSAISISEAQDLIRVIELSGVVPFVRLTNNDANLIKRVLDAGARGIIVPMINSAAEARSAVQSALYPPQGTRGVGLGRASKYGFAFHEYASKINRELITVVQIEHADAVRNIDEIFEVDGVDAFMVGPYDLSASLGVSGKFNHPRVLDALKTVHQAARRHKMPAGFHVVQPDASEVKKRIREGYSFLALSLDTLYLGGSARSVLSSARKGK